MADRCPRCQGTARRLAGGLCARCLIGDALASGPDGAPSRRADSLVDVPGHRVVAELARGGMGVVYRAVQDEPPREVALKMLRPQALESPEMLGRFRQEARTLAALEHPGILPVYETGEVDGLPWFTMKLATGGTLAARRERYARDWRGIASLMRHLSEAVRFAHEHGVLHRDLKPGNVLFDEADRAYVADFGLARALTTDSDLTRTVSLLGTPHYLAPEILASDARAATTASDQYALGAVFYELLSGRPPFEADGIPLLMRRIVEESPVPPSRRIPGVPRDLEVVCLKAVAKEPSRRYASLRAFEEDLEAWLGGRPIAARPVSAAEALAAWARRNPALASAMALAVVLGTALAANAVQTGRRLRAADAELRRHLYAADMALAGTALSRDDLDAARRLLDRHLPEPGAEDLRGLEWRILHAAAAGDSPQGFTGHTSTVVAVSPSPDGRTVVSASWDGTVREWDSRTLAETRSWGGGSGHRWFALDRSRTGNQVVAVDAVQAGLLRVDLDTGVARTVPGPLGQFLRFSPDGSGFLAQTEARFWSVDGGLEWRDDRSAVPRTLPDTGRRAAFSPDGRRLVTGAMGDRLRLWEWPSMKADGELGPVTPVVDLRFSPDGTKVVSAGFNGGLKLWDATRRTLVAARIAHGGTTLGSAVFSPDGRLLATAGGDHVLRLWDAETLEPRQVLRGPADQVWALAWAPDGRRLYSTTRDAGVRVWPLDRERLDRSRERFHDRLLEFTPDGTGLVVETPGHGELRVVDAETLSVRHRHPDAGQPLGFAKGGRTLLFLDPSGESLRTLDAADLAESGTVPVRLQPPIPPDRRVLHHRHDPASGVFAVQFDDGEIRAWDSETGLELPKTERRSRCDCEFWVLPGGRIALIGDGFEVELVDARSGRLIGRLAGHRSPPGVVGTSPDGRWLVSADEGGSVILWENQGLRRIHQWNEFDTVAHLRFSADGRTLVVGDSRRVHFIHLATRRVAGSLDLESTVHNTLALAPGDRALALIGRDGRLASWKVARN